jgi:hypothetical protein
VVELAIFVMVVIIWEVVDAFYEPYINGEKELRQLNEEYCSNAGLVK